MNHAQFQEVLQQKGRELYRTMPWRDDTRPYYVLVSEIMLQQTQVDRVVPKFLQFIALFPSEQELAAASLADVLTVWSGLGYNRRAKYLHEAAKAIVIRGSFPDNEAELIKLPGVGRNTAGAIMAYAYNQPAYFIETNVRTVFIHHFFEDEDSVDDKQILSVLRDEISLENPREFYWSVMDYGTYLKKQRAVMATRSRHYRKQSPLDGSVRQVRGQIIRALTDSDISRQDLMKQLAADERFDKALDGLVHEGLISQTGEKLHLTK